MFIETERLWLRQWEPGDLAPFAEMNADSEVMRFFPAALTRQQSDAMAGRCEKHISEHGWGLWAVQVKNGPNFIGFVGLSVPAAKLPFNPCVEIGWRLAKEAWGKGYASEAAFACLKFAFEKLNLDEVVSFTSIINTRSQAVMERTGMKRDSETFVHPNVPEGSVLRTHCLYRITRNDFLSRNSSS
ncbi:MAG: GNAT family N-acetyltransferase [Candidatus Riflebacteria bacterium]